MFFHLRQPLVFFVLLSSQPADRNDYAPSRTAVPCELVPRGLARNNPDNKKDVSHHSIAAELHQSDDHLHKYAPHDDAKT